MCVCDMCECVHARERDCPCVHVCAFCDSVDPFFVRLRKQKGTVKRCWSN